MESEVKSDALSLSDLDSKQGADTPFSLDVLSPKTGRPLGVTIQVIGDQADAVQKFVRRELNTRRREEAMREKRGKDPVVQLIEDDEAFTIEATAVRTVGWSGIKEEFTPENAKRLYKLNPYIRQQVLEASSNAANFSKV